MSVTITPSSIAEIDNNFEDDISLARVPNATALAIVGYNGDLDIGTEDLWLQGGSLSYLTSQQVMRIASTSASDTSPLGVFIGGINDAGALVTDFVLLNGVTPVLTTTAFRLVHFMFLSGTGTTNIGTITATSNVSVTVQCSIRPQLGISQHGFYRVPVGKSLVLKQIEFGAAKTTGGSSPVIEISIFARFTPTSPWIAIFNRQVDTSVQDVLVIPLPNSGVASAGADLRFSATTDQNNTQCLLRVTGVLYSV